MKSKRKMVVAALVAFCVLGGACFALRADSALGQFVLGEGQIGMPVSDNEAADLVGGCVYQKFVSCGSGSGCAASCYFSCIICFGGWEYCNIDGTNSCGGSCGDFNIRTSGCGT